MKSGDPTHEQKIKEQLKIIAGLEAAILQAIEEDDKHLLDLLRPRRKKYYKELRALLYGQTD